MKRIYKYDLHYYSVPELLKLPKDAKIIDFDIQDKAFKMWALVNPEAESENRVFILAMTGQPLEWKVLETYGTRIIKETGIVVHLLELEPTTKAFDASKDARIKDAN